jgi:hypothetical protein
MDAGKLLIATEELDEERHNVWTINGTASGKGVLRLF